MGRTVADVRVAARLGRFPVPVVTQDEPTMEPA